MLSGSVALLADLIHNFGDALTAIPLGIAFYVRSYRAEKAAGLFVVLTIFVSACVALAKALMGLEKNEEAKAALESCARMNPKHPQPHLFLSQVYFRLGNAEQATAEKELSLRLRRENPTIMESPQARPFPAAPRR